MSLSVRALGYQSDSRTADIIGATALSFVLQPVSDPFSGTWSGGVETFACSADGAFGQDFCNRYPRVSDVTTPSITAIRLVLRQTGGTVVGEADFNGAWRAPVTGTVVGGD